MRILSDPIQVKWNSKQTCDANDIYGVIGCGATLEVEYTDIYTKEYEKGYWSESNQEFVHYMAHSFLFKCPCCGAENEIKFNEIPDKIRKIIKKREKEKIMELKKK